MNDPGLPEETGPLSNSPLSEVSVWVTASSLMTAMTDPAFTMREAGEKV